jgi:exodeoxyribonuclease V alpha subunit
MTVAVPERDPFDVRRAVGAGGLLRTFNDAGVLAAADVHVATRLAHFVPIDDESVRLAAALAVRAPRVGHVFVDLATIHATATVDTDEPVDLAALPWPEAGAWCRAVAASGLAAVGEDGAPDDVPLRLVGTALYLDRYWREERRIAEDLRAFAATAAGDVDVDLLAAGLARLFHSEDGDQRLAAASAVLRRFAVVAGGPGTGKTTTVARIVALLAEQAAAAGAGAPLVALAAPTGKAAARLEEAVHEQAAAMEVADGIRAQLIAAGASTLHRLLGRRPRSHSRFRHHRGNRLPHDVVVVDETSMVSLPMMARLVEAVRPDARLILVGDPGQLSSIEAGAVLGDIVGPAAHGLRIRAAARHRLEVATGDPVEAVDPPPGAEVGDGIVVLERGHRFGGAIADVAAAVRRGDADRLIATLARAEPEDVTWLPVDVAAPGVEAATEAVRDGAVASAAQVIAAARAGDAATALGALASFRVLCAHRRGPYGVAAWAARVEEWLAGSVDRFGAEGRWYLGRPLLVTENDYELQLFNGDTGVVVAADADRVVAAFERRGDILTFSPTRLAAVDTVFAMTVHKSQGSQFDTAAVLLPDAASPILTRELLYTAVTRARTRLILAGTEDALRAAVARPAARTSGLRPRLWGV